MFTFQGMSVDVGVSVDGDCDIAHTVGRDYIEINFGRTAGSLQLCMTEESVAKLANIATVALDDFRRRRAEAEQSDRL